MKKVFITGASGFVAGHLIKLLKSDYQIIGLTHSQEKPLEKNVEFVKVDILDQKELHGILKKYLPDFIVHLAAKAKVWEKDYKDIFQTNLFGTQNIYESIIEIKKDQDYQPKIIYVSSAEVYGKTTNPAYIDETMPFYPTSYYGSSKVAADRLSFQYSQSHKLNIVILRPFLHAGPGQGKGFFIPDMASQIAAIEKGQQDTQIMVGNLESFRDCTDVRDMVKAYKLVLEGNTRSGEEFNIGSGHAYKMKVLLNKLLSHSDKKVEIVEDPTRMRPSDTPIISCNNQKFVAKFGWKPAITIDQTLKDALDYWRSIN